MIEGAYGVPGQEAPSFAIVPTIKVTKANLTEGWSASLQEEAPAEIVEAAERQPVLPLGRLSARGRVAGVPWT